MTSGWWKTKLTGTLAIFAITLMVVSCGPNIVKVSPLREFPRPVVDRYPADIALYYPKEFREYTYVEERPGARGGDWEITLGPPQVQVFDMVFGTLFRTAEHTDSEEVPSNGVANALFVPRVEEFQFALPVDTNIKIFEIWVKYSVAVIDRQGNEVMRWPFTAYGKTPTAFMKSNSAAINSAAIIALRDAGASMISGFKRDRKLKEWLEQQEPETAPATVSVVETPEKADDIDAASVEDQR